VCVPFSERERPQRPTWMFGDEKPWLLGRLCACALAREGGRARGRGLPRLRSRICSGYRSRLLQCGGWDLGDPGSRGSRFAAFQVAHARCRWFVACLVAHARSWRFVALQEAQCANRTMDKYRMSGSRVLKAMGIAFSVLYIPSAGSRSSISSAGPTR